MSNKTPMQLIWSGYPMERTATDILGELSETDKGKKYILVVADYFTKWAKCFLYPISIFWLIYSFTLHNDGYWAFIQETTSPFPRLID